MGVPSRLRVIAGTGGEQGRNPGGRPTKYDPAFCDIAEFTLSQGPGYSLISVCVAVGVAHSTLMEWLKLHPELKAAIDRGRMQGLFVAEKTYNDLCLGPSMNTAQLQALRIGIQNRSRALDASLRQEWLNPEADDGKPAEDAPDLSELTDDDLAELDRITAKIGAAKAADRA